MKNVTITTNQIPPLTNIFHCKNSDLFKSPNPNPNTKSIDQMSSKLWKWILGLIYIFAVATIWIAASFVVQSVVDSGVSPFLITYICNSLFVVYLPIVEIGRYLEDKYGTLCCWKRDSKKDASLNGNNESEVSIMLSVREMESADRNVDDDDDVEERELIFEEGGGVREIIVEEGGVEGVDEKGRWTRVRVAKTSLLICPFWFLAQLTFNLSLKFTSVTSNTILSSASSLFTFLVSLVFLSEKFTLVKFISVLLCMGGTIIVSLGDSESSSSASTGNTLIGDFLALLSAAFYAVYITLIRVKLPDDDDDERGQASMAQFLGFLGLFNLFIFLPMALILNITKLEPFSNLTWKQVGLIIGKGLLDNVLSDYLWAKAVLLTTTTVATAGLAIQVPLAAIVDTLIGNAPHPTDYLGAIAVIIGFVGITVQIKRN